MSITIAGTIQRVNLGPGAWALQDETAGTTYELYNNGPEPLRQDGLKVKVEGKVRPDVMTFAAIGPVLDVQSFEILTTGT